MKIYQKIVYELMVYVSMFWISITYQWGGVLYRKPKNDIWRGLNDFTWLLMWKYDEKMYVAYFGRKRGLWRHRFKGRG